MADDDVAGESAHDADKSRVLGRRVSVPLWAAGLAFLALGIALGALVVSMLGRDQDSGVTVADRSDSATTVTPTTVERQLETTITISTTVTTQPALSTTTTGPTTTLPEPRGTLAIVGPPAGAQFGQGFANGPCATWELLFQNNSNTEIVQVVFRPVLG